MGPVKQPRLPLSLLLGRRLAPQLICTHRLLLEQRTLLLGYHQLLFLDSSQCHTQRPGHIGPAGIHQKTAVAGTVQLLVVGINGLALALQNIHLSP